MNVWLLRHGIAEERSVDGEDASRRLTAEGVRKTRLAAQGLARLIKPPQAILTSPKVRAVQTAELVAHAMQMKFSVLDALASEDARDIGKALARRHETSLLLVGHEPSLSALVRQWCSIRGQGGLRLRKAGCACVQLVKRGSTAVGTLQWLATARMLRRLASE